MLGYLNFDYEWPSPGSVPEHQCLEIVSGQSYFPVAHPDVADLMTDECPWTVTRVKDGVTTNFRNYWIGPDAYSNVPYDFNSHLSVDIGVITKINGFSLRNGQHSSYKDR